jgi:hypothetical protein
MLKKKSPGKLLKTCHKTCGSELARDEGLSVNVDVECQSAIASKLAPTVVLGELKDGLQTDDILCL